MRRRCLALAASLLALPLAARAQTLPGLRMQGLRCLQNTAPSACKPFLETSYRLKKQAEAAKQLRCYTALLGFEAQVIAARGAGAAEPSLEPGFSELTAECVQIR